jgi:hypothetical protein
MRTQVLFGQGFLKIQKPITINQNPFQRSQPQLPVAEKKEKLMQKVDIKRSASIPKTGKSKA